MTIPGPWRKSSRSGGSNGNCVEARFAGEPEVSDSNYVGTRPVMPINQPDYLSLISGIKAGDFDLERLED